MLLLVHPGQITNYVALNEDEEFWIGPDPMSAFVVLPIGNAVTAKVDGQALQILAGALPLWVDGKYVSALPVTVYPGSFICFEDSTLQLVETLEGLKPCEPPKREAIPTRKGFLRKCAAVVAAVIGAGALTISVVSWVFSVSASYRDVEVTAPLLRQPLSDDEIEEFLINAIGSDLVSVRLGDTVVTIEVTGNGMRWQADVEMMIERHGGGRKLHIEFLNLQETLKHIQHDLRRHPATASFTAKLEGRQVLVSGWVMPAQAASAKDALAKLQAAHRLPIKTTVNTYPIQDLAVVSVSVSQATASAVIRYNGVVRTYEENQDLPIGKLVLVSPSGVQIAATQGGQLFIPLKGVP